MNLETKFLFKDPKNIESFVKENIKHLNLDFTGFEDQILVGREGQIAFEILPQRYSVDLSSVKDSSYKIAPELGTYGMSLRKVIDYGNNGLKDTHFSNEFNVEHSDDDYPSLTPFPVNGDVSKKAVGYSGPLSEHKIKEFFSFLNDHATSLNSIYKELGTATYFLKRRIEQKF